MSSFSKVKSKNILSTIDGCNEIGRPILADVPTYLGPTMSDFDKGTYLPKNRTSFMDDPKAHFTYLVLETRKAGCATGKSNFFDILLSEIVLKVELA